MNDNDEVKKESHYPEDPDAPSVKENYSAVRRFYLNNKKFIDYSAAGLLLISTAFTVSFSLYIIVVKFF
jgi:hypothetical protein